MKYKTQLITAACVAAFAFTASAASKKAAAAASASPSPSASPAASASATAPAALASPGKPTTTTAKGARAIPFHGMVASVDQKANTFTIAGKEKSRVFRITDKTAIMKAGAGATMKDVVEKEEVRGSYWKQADGTLEAKTVKVGPMTDAEKAEAAKHNKKRKTDTKEESEAAEALNSPAPSPAASPSASPKKK